MGGEWRGWEFGRFGFVPHYHLFAKLKSRFGAAMAVADAALVVSQAHGPIIGVNPMKPFETREYRCGLFYILFLTFGALAMPIATISIYQKYGLTWLSAVYICISPFAVLAALFTLTAKVQITETELIVRSEFRKRVYSKSIFSGVSQERGCALAMIYVDGGALKLPSWLSHNAANTLRTWLKRPNLSTESKVHVGN